MKINRLGSKVVLLLILVTLFASGCTATPTPQPPIAVAAHVVTQAFKDGYMEAQAFYSQYAKLDAQESFYWGNVLNLHQRLRDQDKDDYVLMQSCYTNTEEFAISILTTTYGPSGIGGQDTQPFLNLLHLQQTFPEGLSVQKCQDIAISMIVFSRSLRAEGFNYKSEILRIHKERALLESGTIGGAVVFEFYQKYGEDLQYFIKQGDAAFTSFVSVIPEKDRLPIPADFVGFPTKLLTITTYNAKIGETYRAIAENRMDPPAGTYAYNYGVSYDPATGLYTLSKAAAAGYIALLLAPSPESLQNLEQGCTSVFADCSDAATATPTH